MYRFHNGAIIQFLIVSNLTTTRYTAGVVMPDIGRTFTQATDNIAFVDLHMIDIKQHLHIRRIDTLTELKSPITVVGHIVKMIDTTIEDFHVQYNAIFFGMGHNFLEPIDAIFHSNFIVHALSIARKTDQIFIPGFRHPFDVVQIIFDQS